MGLDELFSAQNSAAVGGIGLLITVFGTLLTLLGLVLTFRQARAAASTALNAQLAVENFKFKALQHDGLRDLAEARYALDVTKRYLTVEAWREASDSYEDARRAMIRVEVTFQNLASPTKSAIKQAHQQMGKFCNKIDAAIVGKGGYPDRAKTTAVIRKNYELLALIDREIRASEGK